MSTGQKPHETFQSVRKESESVLAQRDMSRAGWRGFLCWCVWYHVLFILLILGILGALVLRYAHSWVWIGLHFYAAPIAGAGIVLIGLFVVAVIGVLIHALTQGI